MRERAIELSKRLTPKYVKPTPHSQEVLSKIKETENYNLVISNAREDRLKEFLEITELIDLIDFYIGVPEDIGKDPNFSIVKYKTDIINEYTKKFGVNKKVVIGDQETDVEAGKLAGAITYRFLNPSLFTKEKIEAIRKTSKADHVITDLREVLKELNF